MFRSYSLIVLCSALCFAADEGPLLFNRLVEFRTSDGDNFDILLVESDGDRKLIALRSPGIAYDRQSNTFVKDAAEPMTYRTYLMDSFFTPLRSFKSDAIFVMSDAYAGTAQVFIVEQAQGLTWVEEEAGFPQSKAAKKVALTQFPCFFGMGGEELRADPIGFNGAAYVRLISADTDSFFAIRPSSPLCKNEDAAGRHLALVAEQVAVGDPIKVTRAECLYVAAETAAVVSASMVMDGAKRVLAYAVAGDREAVGGGATVVEVEPVAPKVAEMAAEMSTVATTAVQPGDAGDAVVTKVVGTWTVTFATPTRVALLDVAAKEVLCAFPMDRAMGAPDGWLSLEVDFVEVSAPAYSSGVRSLRLSVRAHDDVVVGTKVSLPWQAKDQPVTWLEWSKISPSPTPAPQTILIFTFGTEWAAPESAVWLGGQVYDQTEPGASVLTGSDLKPVMVDNTMVYVGYCGGYKWNIPATTDPAGFCVLSADTQSEWSSYVTSAKIQLIDFLSLMSVITTSDPNVVDIYVSLEDRAPTLKLPGVPTPQAGVAYIALGGKPDAPASPPPTGGAAPKKSPSSPPAPQAPRVPFVVSPTDVPQEGSPAWAVVVIMVTVLAAIGLGGAAIWQYTDARRRTSAPLSSSWDGVTMESGL